MASNNNPSQQRPGQGNQKQPEIDPQPSSPARTHPTPDPQAGDPSRRQAQSREEGSQSQRQQRGPGEAKTPERTGGERELSDDETEQPRTAVTRQDPDEGPATQTKQDRNPGAQSQD